MADHLQQQILDAIQARVIAGGTIAGDRVYVDQLDPLPKGVRAAVLVREGENGDDVQPGSINDLQERTLDVEIGCVLRASDGVAGQARAFGLAVEKLISPKVGNTALGALCFQWSLTNSKLTQNGEGDEAVATRLLTYQFKYRVRKGAPDAAA